MSFGRFTLGALVGGAIGAVVGMLLAPRSGAETREILKEEWNKRYTDSMDSVRETYDRSVSTAKEKYEETVGDLKEKTEDLRKRAQKITEEFEETGRRALNHLSNKDKNADAVNNSEITGV